jgi:hypothetical protein
LSLVSIVPKWAGRDKAIPLHHFFEAIDSAARIGNWTDPDRLQIAVIKLTDSARAFYNGSSEVHELNVTWATFKTTFQWLFRDVRTDQYHFPSLKCRGRKRENCPQSLQIGAGV